MIARSVDADQRVVAAAGVGLHVEGVAIEKVDRMIGPGQRVIAARLLPSMMRASPKR